MDKLGLITPQQCSHLLPSSTELGTVLQIVSFITVRNATAHSNVFATCRHCSLTFQALIATGAHDCETYILQAHWDCCKCFKVLHPPSAQAIMKDDNFHIHSIYLYVGTQMLCISLIIFVQYCYKYIVEQNCRRWWRKWCSVCFLRIPTAPGGGGWLRDHRVCLPDQIVI